MDVPVKVRGQPHPDSAQPEMGLSFLMSYIHIFNADVPTLQVQW